MNSSSGVGEPAHLLVADADIFQVFQELLLRLDPGIAGRLLDRGAPAADASMANTAVATARPARCIAGHSFASSPPNNADSTAPASAQERIGWLAGRIIFE